MRTLSAVIEVFVRPERRRPSPPPVEVDMTRVFVVGLVLWGLALGVAVVLWRVGVITSTPVWSCVAGAGLGVIGLVWARGRHPQA